MNHFLDQEEFEETPVKDVLENFNLRLLPNLVHSYYFEILKY